MKKHEDIKKERAEASSNYEKVHYNLDKEEFVEPLGGEIEALREKLNLKVEETGQKSGLIRKISGMADQHAINSLVVQIFNLLVPYLVELTEKLSRISELHRKFYMSLVPLIDSKDREWFAKAMEELYSREEKFQEYVDALSGLVNAARRITLGEAETMESLKSSFYFWFERRFRAGGLKEELKVYLPYLRDAQPVLDFGCGRGEMLELLKEEGIEASGVDINAEFVEECESKGLKCIHGDGIEYLSSLEDECLGSIFSAQVLEHFPIGDVEKIIAISWKKVRKGGVFIAETVNVASPAAFHGAFLLDPTHISPLHHQTLSFILESSGWKVEKIIWKNLPEQLMEFPAHNEREAAIRENLRRINGFLFSHQDYAVVARKP